MKITKIKVENFRLLKKFSLDLEKDLSLVIGKNNSGKTSLLSILEKFLKNPTPKSFSFDDFNIDFQKQLKELITNPPPEDQIGELGITMKLFIKYEEGDNLANISEVMMDLDPENNYVVLSFGYYLHHDKYGQFIADFQEFKENELKDDKEISDQEILNDFLRTNHTTYFSISKKSLEYDLESGKENDGNIIDLLRENIKLDNIINFKLISAKREVSNKDSDKTLSILSSEYYEKREEAQKNSPEIKQFKEQLRNTDKHLNDVYVNLFKTITKKVAQFGGIREGDSNINVVSTLQHKELLKGNTTVMYDHHEEYLLPENYNGLGYLNLISMIFKIEVLIGEFRKDNNEHEKPADINLLFIEEPEAHTHPQMQYVFINNIKDILKKSSNGEDGAKFNIQTVISTHSSHIAAESTFNDIKYFYRNGKQEVVAKNLKDLEKEYGDEEKQAFKFLKQYLTLHRAELFFADKAIFIEGDTERILLPAMMKKIDEEDAKAGSKETPLLSQNISIVEVGAYSHIFEKFIDFIGVKSLIITDIDSVRKLQVQKDGKTTTSTRKRRVNGEVANNTSNYSLQFYFKAHFDSLDEDDNPLEFLKRISIEQKQINKRDGVWIQSDTGNVLLIYQVNEKNQQDIEYHARSFEDAFFHISRGFIKSKIDEFKSLKNTQYFNDGANDPYTLAEECVGKKPSFAMEILLNSVTNEEGVEFSNWQTPQYIKEGLSWLKQK